jgi:hypothetical protein
VVDDRPGAPPENVFWAGNLGEAGHFLHGMESLWLPRSLLQLERRAQLVDALIAAIGRPGPPATSPRIYRAPAIVANGTSMTATDHCCSALASTDNTCSSTQNGSW